MKVRIKQPVFVRKRMKRITGNGRILVFFLLLLSGLAQRQQEVFAQSSWESKDAADMEELSAAPPLSEEDIVMSQSAGRNGWFGKDTVFTICLPEEWDYGELTPFVEYRKLEDTIWTVLSPGAEDPFRFSFTERDRFYDGAYQFRTGAGRYLMPEEEWVTIPFRKDREAPSVRTECPDADVERSGKKYYGGAQGEHEVIQLIFTENLWEYQEGNADRPNIVILRDNRPIEQKEAEKMLSWTSPKKGQLCARIRLPYEKDRETEYRIQADYRDDAGNGLQAEEGSFGQVTDVQNGTFVTGSLILDARPPRLLSLSAQGDSVLYSSPDGRQIPLYKNTEGDDILFTFVIEEAQDGWAEEAVWIRIWNQTEEKMTAELTGDSAAISWFHEGSRHTARFGFDGEEGKECVYQLQLGFRDRAGNFLEDGREKEEDGFPAEIQEEQGLCVSGPFILDHAAPHLSFTFTEAVRLVKDGRDYSGEKTPLPGYVSYYNTDIQAEIVLQDAHAELILSENGTARPEGFRVLLVKEDEETQARSRDVTEELKWTVQEDVFTAAYCISEEGDYRLEAEYADTAGNPMQAAGTKKNAVQGTLEAGCYKSPLLILDRTAPVISLEYTAEPYSSWGERTYFNTAVSLRVTITDQNFRVQEFKNILLGFEARGSGGEDRRKDTELQKFLEELSGTKISRTVWSAELPLDTEANYSIPIGLTDLAGNAAVWEDGREETIGMEYPVTDCTPPGGITLEYPGGEAFNYASSGWIFACEPFPLKVLSEDGTSGIHEIRFEITDEDGKTTVKTKNFESSPQGSFEMELPPDVENFKGTVCVAVCDRAGNCLRKNWNCVVESPDRHQETGAVLLTAQTEPSRIVEGVKYYNTDVAILLTMQDLCSGIRSFRYSGGNTLSGGRDYGAEAGSGLDGVPEREITYEYSQELLLNAASNNENDIRVAAEYTDNAGHTGSAEQRFCIDVTVPEITVEYDLKEPQNGRYYNQARTAVVTIRERNFDEKDVDFQITGSGGAVPEISGWSSSGSGDDTLHVCRVLFEDDGDYTFTLAFQDLAGNRAVYGQTDEFTIDKTAPELEVSWDNQDVCNEIYFADSRTAVIDILERNFKEELIDITVTAEGDAEEVPAASAWIQNGEHHTARIRFMEDGIYTLTVKGKDLAGNEAELYESETFVIDQTPPELEFLYVQDRSANKGEVRPGVRYSDTNCGQEKAWLSLTGYQNGGRECEGFWKQLQNGMEFRMKDFEYSKEQDDLYTLEAVVRDLAGNESRGWLTFSVNRFGSVYTFSPETEALVGTAGRYYTNQEQDIIVTEINVDTLTFQEIVCGRNGELFTLQEGRDYTVKENSDASGWKQYIYRIDADCFQEDGRYVLTIYSEDRAENASDTGSKGKKIEFAVDKTAPVILASGAEDGGRYRESAREITLDIQDNLQLEEAVVTLNGERIVYSGADLAEQDGRLVLRIEGENYWQELSVTARDAAGNTAETLKLRLLVTPNLLVQLVTNRTLCYSIAGVLGLLAAAAACVLHARARQAEEEEGNRQRRKADRKKDL